MSERRLTALRYHARLVYTLRGFTASDARAYARCEIQTKHEVHTIHKSAIHNNEGADYGRCSGRLMQKLQMVQGTAVEPKGAAEECNVLHPSLNRG